MGCDVQGMFEKWLNKMGRGSEVILHINNT